LRQEKGEIMTRVTILTAGAVLALAHAGAALAEKGDTKALEICQQKAVMDFNVPPSQVQVEHRPQHDGHYVVDFFVTGTDGHGYCVVGREGKVHKYKITRGKP
jgi:hypothetical protein